MKNALNLVKHKQRQITFTGIALNVLTAQADNF